MGQNLSFYGLLPAYSQTGKLGKKTNYNLFVSSTIDAFDKKVNSVEYPATDLQLYIQPSFIYVHSPNFNLAGSYTYVRNNPLNDNYVNEHRLWQQMIFSYALGKGKLNHRFRIEERFIEDKKTGHYPFHTRGRYQLAFSMPLQGRTLEKNEFLTEQL